MRSYALALLAASGSAAMPASYNMGTTTAKVALSATATNYKEIAAGQILKWGYDAAKLYVSYDAVGLANTKLAKETTDIAAIGVKVKVGSAGGLNLVCSHKSGSETTNQAIWHVLGTTTSAAVSTGCTTVAWNVASCMAKDNIASPVATTAVTAVTDNAVQNAVATTGGEYKILATSSSKLDTARTGITCHMDVEITLGSASLTLNAAAAAGLNKINIENVQNFGMTTIASDSKTNYADGIFFNYTPTAATAVASTASKYSTAAGQTVAGLVVTHTVNAWTATANVYIEYAWKMTLTTALANSKKNSATTCSKIATAVWQCAIMETTGITASATINVILKFKAYRSDAALAFTSGLPEIAANLGKVANVIKEYEMTNVAAGTAAATAVPSIPTGFVAGMLQSNKWAWYAAGNTMDATLKIFDGKVQYFSTEADAAAATAVLTLVTAYAKTAWIGACLEALCVYGAKELTATAAAAAGAGSLGLASVGAAIVLAMAF